MAISNSIVQKSQNKTSLTAYLSNDAVRAQVAKVVGGKDSTRFISSIISAVQATPALQDCTNASILSGALQGEALKLPPSPQLGFFYLVPFNNKKKGVTEAQFILSAKGYKQLAMRSGQYADIDVIYIHEGEYLGRDKYTGKQKFEFIENDDERENLPIIGYLAYFETVNGFRKQIFWTKEKMEKHANRYSHAFNLKDYQRLQRGEIPENEMWKYSSYWYTAFDEMAEKTMIRQLLSKWALLSTEMAMGLDADNTVINENGTKEYVEMEEIAETPINAPEAPETAPEPQEAPKQPKATKTAQKAEKAAEPEQEEPEGKVTPDDILFK